jgi:hypothetical protein
MQELVASEIDGNAVFNGTLVNWVRRMRRHPNALPEIGAEQRPHIDVVTGIHESFELPYRVSNSLLEQISREKSDYWNQHYRAFELDFGCRKPSNIVFSLPFVPTSLLDWGICFRFIVTRGDLNSGAWRLLFSS